VCQEHLIGDVQWRCADNNCAPIEGRCNGVFNCPDHSDEEGCGSTTTGLTLEAMSGFTATIETPAVSDVVFYDREYTFDSLGSFTGKSFIKMSHDKEPTYNVQMKLRLPRPMTVYVAKLEDTELPWLHGRAEGFGWTDGGSGWTVAPLDGITYHGIHETKHTDWATHVGQDIHELHYGPGQVWQKTFPAGPVEMPGTGDGSYVMFASTPTGRPQGRTPLDPSLLAYWDNGVCGAGGDDHNYMLCGGYGGPCPDTISTDRCTTGHAELVEYHGDHVHHNSYVRDGCEYFFYAQYRCTAPPQGEVVEPEELVAYWDNGVCGPGGDDHNYMLCGYNGLVRTRSSPASAILGVPSWLSTMAIICNTIPTPATAATTFSTLGTAAQLRQPAQPFQRTW